MGDGRRGRNELVQSSPNANPESPNFSLKQ
jgi:hypothetical protein